jgi:transglutaminase-like putative cysteine protease
MKRSLFPILIILSLVLSLSGTHLSVQASGPFPLLDLDQDGIPNQVELAGWYNLAGGPFHTDPNMADTDRDGLTDSQEKLYNTDPTDPKSPGIAVQYASSFKTLEYYNTKDPAYLKSVQGGNQYLLSEGAVLRRGTTFKISALNTAAAQLTITGVGMTPLTAVPDPARGGWNVTLPPNGTVGTYTAAINDGAGWSKNMPIYVIFELPTDLTPAQVSTYVYDDDPANKRDEVAVWWRAMDWKYYNADSPTLTPPCTPADSIICSNWQYHTISGFAQAFWTEQFTKNVLVNFTLPAINGMTDQFAASQSIGDKADASVRVNFASVKNNFSSATKVYYYPNDPLHPTTPYRTDGGGCETSAGVFTAMLRSAGIAARPLIMDYNKTDGHGEDGNFGVFEYDTAVMLWAKAPADTAKSWYVSRSFNGAEAEYKATASWTDGALSPIRPLATVGSTTNLFKHFQDAFADGIHSTNEGWDFQVGSLGGGMVNTEWTGSDVPGAEFVPLNRDLGWNSKYPLEIQQSPYVDIYNCQLWQGDGWAPSEWGSSSVSNPVGRTAAQTYYLPVGIPTSLADTENWPFNPKPTACSASSAGTAACAALLANWQPVCPALPGPAAARPQAPASQTVQPDMMTWNHPILMGSLDVNGGLNRNGTGNSKPLAAAIAGTYAFTTLDTHHNGLVDTVRISVALKIASPGTYTVDADLYDGQGGYVGHAVWTGTGPTATLDYPITGTLAPYSLEHLNLADAAGTNLSSSYAPVYKISTLGSPVNVPSAISAGSQNPGAAPLLVTVASPFTGTPVDVNANGRFDQLTIATTVDVTVAGGTYWLEGLLVDDQNTPVVWSTSTPKALNVGLNQALQMTFDGRMLFNQLPLAMNQKFTLVSVKVFSGTPGAAILEVDLPVTGFTTPVYTRAQFEPCNPVRNLFQDDMEGGVTPWTVLGTSQWGQTTSAWHSRVTAWAATGSATKSGLLSLSAPLDFTNVSSPWLMFDTAYQLANGQSFKVEASTNGTTWTVLKTFTGSTTYWSTELIDLSAYGKKAGVRLRFNAQSNAGSVWYIDDVSVNTNAIIQIFVPMMSR